MARDGLAGTRAIEPAQLVLILMSWQIRNTATGVVAVDAGRKEGGLLMLKARCLRQAHFRRQRNRLVRQLRKASASLGFAPFRITACPGASRFSRPVLLVASLWRKWGCQAGGRTYPLHPNLRLGTAAFRRQRNAGPRLCAECGG